MNVAVRTAPGVNGTIVVLAAWCPRCRSEAMPDRHGGCSFCQTPIVDEDRLTARDAIAAINPNGGTMTATATRTCKTDGCTQPVLDRAGPYGGLCSTHKDQKRAARVQTGGTQRTPTGLGMSPLRDAARKIVPIAAKVDRARATLSTLPAIAEAKATFDEATRRASVTPSPDNLARVVDATKQLQTFAPRRTKAETELEQAGRALELALRALATAARQAAA